MEEEIYNFERDRISNWAKTKFFYNFYIFEK